MNQSKTDLGIVNESQLLRFGINACRTRGFEHFVDSTRLFSSPLNRLSRHSPIAAFACCRARPKSFGAVGWGGATDGWICCCGAIATGAGPPRPLNNRPTHFPGVSNPYFAANAVSTIASGNIAARPSCFRSLSRSIPHGERVPKAAKSVTARTVAITVAHSVRTHMERLILELHRTTQFDQENESEFWTEQMVDANSVGTMRHDPLLSKWGQHRYHDVVLLTLRMLLVSCGAHSLSSGVPFAHVRTIFSVSVIVSTSEMVDFRA
jgi:hypothetical protein